MIQFIEEVKYKFNENQYCLIDYKTNYGQLDCFINNAAIIDEGGPHQTTDKKFEMTFMVNTVAPFITTCKLLTELDPQPKRIINITSSVMSNL